MGMKRIETFDEVLEYLKSNMIITTPEGNRFVMRNQKVVSFYRGNRIVMSLDDFINLYRKLDFYEYRDESCEIDPLKDKEYYSFKHK